MSEGYGRGKKGAGKRKSGTRNAAARRRHPQTPPRGRGLRLYLGGVLSGVFISFIAWLATLPGQGTNWITSLAIDNQGDLIASCGGQYPNLFGIDTVMM